jgi:glutamate 5-kinase
VPGLRSEEPATNDEGRHRAEAPGGEREDIAASARTVVKIGSSSLTTRDGAIDDARIATLTSALAARVRDGGQVLLVSSGAIAAGMAPLGLKGGARRIGIVTRAEDLARVKAGKTGQGSFGTGGMSTKVESALIATAAGIPTVVTAAAEAAAALAGEPTGTYFAATGQRPRTRLLWLAHAAVARGSLRLDKGAVEAVVGRRASLLPAGIIGVEGAFDTGDPVDLTDENGAVIARGLVNYDAKEIPGLMGRSTRWLSSKLGQEYEREVIHRDDLVILGRLAVSNRPKRC